MVPLIFSSIPVILQILSASGIVPAQVGSLTANLLTPFESLVGALRTGAAKTDDALAALAALTGVVAVLKAQTNLPVLELTEIQNVDANIQAALKAYAQAANGFDISLYAPIAPVT